MATSAGPGTFKHLREAGYRGLVSLETHWRRQALDRDTLHLPGGYRFSFGGEEASERCFDVLQHLFADDIPHVVDSPGRGQGRFTLVPTSLHLQPHVHESTGQGSARSRTR
jgi:hypothetical protein